VYLPLFLTSNLENFVTPSRWGCHQNIDSRECRTVRLMTVDASSVDCKPLRISIASICYELCVCVVCSNSAADGKVSSPTQRLARSVCRTRAPCHKGHLNQRFPEKCASHFSHHLRKSVYQWLYPVIACK